MKEAYSTLCEEMAIAWENLQDYEAQQGLDTLAQTIKEKKTSERGKKLFLDLDETNKPKACGEGKIEEREEGNIEEKE